MQLKQLLDRARFGWASESEHIFSRGSDLRSRHLTWGSSSERGVRHWSPDFVQDTADASMRPHRQTDDGPRPCARPSRRAEAPSCVRDRNTVVSRRSGVNELHYVGPGEVEVSEVQVHLKNARLEVVFGHDEPRVRFPRRGKLLLHRVRHAPFNVDPLRPCAQARSENFGLSGGFPYERTPLRLGANGKDNG